MSDVPTFTDLYQIAQAEVQLRNPALTDWSEGSNLDAVVGAGAILADERIRYDRGRWAAQYVDTATGSDLEALALDRFGLTKKAARASTGTLTFTRGASTGTVTIPAGTTVKGTGADGSTVQVTTDADVDLLSGSSTVDASATSTETGKTGNVASGVLDTMVSSIPADTGITVVNAARFVGGGDAESDERFRARIRLYFQTLRKGTKEALRAGALSVPGVAYATVDEDNILPDDGGYVGVYVSDEDGYCNPLLVAQVTAEEENWRACGIHVVVSVATRETASVSQTVYVLRGADQDAIRSAARDAVVACGASLAPGETLRWSRLVSASHQVSTDVAYVEMPTPSTDIAPSTPDAILRVDAEDVSISVVELP